MTGEFDWNSRCGLTVNGRTSIELRDRAHQTALGHVAGTLDRMDGHALFAVCLWPIPVGEPFETLDLDGDRVPFLQAAGCSERMTVELRLSAASWDQWVIGRGPISGQRDEVITWDAFSTLVYETEVFNANQARPLFVSFWQTGQIVDAHRRPLGS